MGAEPHGGGVSKSVAILYATASGNAEMLAFAAQERLVADGFAAHVNNVADISAARLRDLEVVLIIASTWGEGEPPPDAAEFCSALEPPAQFRLEHLRYAVLALGSLGYTDFCGCGRRIDENLARAGARRLLPRVECDTKFKAQFEQWIARVPAEIRAQT